MLKPAAILALAASFAASGPPARAAFQTCAEKFVSMDIVRCPDGSLPHYAIGDPPGAPTAQGSPKPITATQPADMLYGVWHTSRPGAGYSSALDVPGAYMLNARPGLAQGDLTISPNGTYVWNTFTGTSGRWVRGLNKGIVLYDETNHTKWLVTPSAERILVTDQKQSFSGRK